MTSKFAWLRQTLLGVMLAGIGLALMFFEYRDGAEHAHTTHIFMYMAVFGVGCLLIAPKMIPDAASKLVMIVLDAKKGGSRWTDPPDDKDKKG